MFSHDQTIQLNKVLLHYLKTNIISQYRLFDAAHQTDHVEAVITRSLALSAHYSVRADMVYTIAAYHDVGLAVDRKTHHLVSAAQLRADQNLPLWFSADEIEVMAQAVEDHRASLSYEPRSIYGKIVAEADRLIEPYTVLRRTVQFGLSHYPELSKEAQYARFCHHLSEKYADGGYVRLWLPQSDNAARLEALRTLIREPDRLLVAFETIYHQLIKNYKIY